MKFFFSEFGFCFGGTVISSPAIETVSTDVVSTTTNTRRRSTSGSSSGKHWRPELSVISEDDRALNVSRSQGHESISVVRSSHKKPLNKAKSTGKMSRSHSYSGDYRNFSHAIPMPAFSPTPFVF